MDREETEGSVCLGAPPFPHLVRTKNLQEIKSSTKVFDDQDRDSACDHHLGRRAAEKDGCGTRSPSSTHDN